MTTYEVPLAYTRFRKKVDYHVHRLSGVGLDDLADFDLYPYLETIEDAADEKRAALEAAQDLLHSEGYPAEFLEREP